MNNGQNNTVIEALILASPEPLPVRRIINLIEDMTPGKVSQAVAELNKRYMEVSSSFRIREIAGGYQFYIMPEYTGFVTDMFARTRKIRMTRAALETLAIVAYRQPVTKTDIEHIRGVASDGVLHNLLEKKMITIKGRSEKIGRALQYGTTDEFLKFFGLSRLEDLPKMSEIEELIRASEPQNEYQLCLDPNALDGEMQNKLNVADGTFDPASRNESDDEFDDSNIDEDKNDSTEIDETSSINVFKLSIDDEDDDEDDADEEGVIVDLDITADSSK
ncbi:MAG: SMC-Scp complex subunit ScpB [bacterium]